MREGSKDDFLWLSICYNFNQRSFSHFNFFVLKFKEYKFKIIAFRLLLILSCLYGEEERVSALILRTQVCIQLNLNNGLDLMKTKR